MAGKGSNDYPLPEDWLSWQNKIADLLDIKSDVSLRYQILPKPWFIIPTRSELPESEADGLIATVRSYLFSQGRARNSVRRILSFLEPESSLPFLYAMRYVALREAESHRYWPVLREIVFNNEISYDDVALGLASTASSLWLRLYDATDGALYFPREGPRHIKWPLAHAGLLADDKNILESFGFSLLASGVDVFRMAISSEIDEFVLFVKDWLEENREYARSRFGGLVLSRRSERDVVAELGQQWLRAQQEKLIDRFQSQAYIGKKHTPTRRSLFYNSDKERFEIKIGVGRVKGNKTINLFWNQEKYSIPKQYVASTNETIPIEINLKVDKPGWEDSARIEIDNVIQKISIPIIDKDQSLVFDSVTGIQTKKWEFEHEYYVLLPGKYFDVEKASSLFKDWIPLNSPAGDWQEYTLLWVRTRNPFLEQLPSKLAKDLTSVIEKIEQIVDELKLPSFGHQYRVRLSLIGGELLELGNSRIPIYNNSRPPYLEISGIWKNDMEVILRRKEELSGQLIDIATLLMSKQLSGSNQVVELWKDYGESGQYKISAADTSLEFQLTKDIAAQNEVSNISSLKITANFEDLSGDSQQFPSRYSFSELQIFVKAWPYAELTLEVKSFDSLKTSLIPLQVDQEGVWREKISDLPVAIDDFPRGHVLFEVSWRGLFGITLTALEKGFVSTKDFNLRLEFEKNTFILDISGFLLGSLPQQEFSVSLFSEIPWEKSIDDYPIQVKENSNFEKRIRLDWKPKWLIFWQVGDIAIPIRIIEIYTENLVSDLEIDLQLTISRIGSKWVSLAKKLIDFPHPPSLNKYLLVVPFFVLLNELLQSFRSLYFWKFFSKWQDWDAINYYLKHGFSLFVFKDSPHVGINAQSIIKDKNVHITLSGEKYNGYDLRVGENERAPIAGILKRHPIRSKNNIRFQCLDKFCYCSSCKILMPLRYFSKHVAPYEEVGICSQQNNVRATFDVGEYIDSVIVGVLSDPLLNYNKIIGQLQAVLSGQRIFGDDFSEWLPTLRSLMPSDVDPKVWLQRLLDNLHMLINIISKKTIPWSELELFAQNIGGFEDAICHVVNRIHQITLSK